MVGLLPSLSERALFQKRCEGAGRRPALFQRRDDASSSLIEVRGPSSLPPFSQRRGGWPSPSLSDRTLFAKNGWLPFPHLFQRRSDSSLSSSSLLEGRAPLLYLLSRREGVVSFSRVEVRGPSSTSFLAEGRLLVPPRLLRRRDNSPAEKE